MMDWLIRWLIGAQKAVEKIDALPPDAKKELDEWDDETVRRYHEEQGGIAPPDAPHIDDGGI